MAIWSCNMGHAMCKQEPSLDLYHVPSISAPVLLASDFQLLAPPENSELFWGTLTEEA